METVGRSSVGNASGSLTDNLPHHGDRKSGRFSCSVAMNCFMETGEPASQEDIRSLTIAFDTLTRAAAV
ncbi:hypothetical protein HUG15_10250 [Salicibibacter cibarius]|uniref:Uncharacterized protein n=1 Tax=Salicibibacter cibarius TaxID=2743000 RepID=A0A7T7CBI2_9BACI|nr:hypothetical protein HUG15_10250 [Salicibibacter cibarius]